MLALALISLSLGSAEPQAPARTLTKSMFPTPLLLVCLNVKSSNLTNGTMEQVEQLPSNKQPAMPSQRLPFPVLPMAGMDQVRSLMQNVPTTPAGDLDFNQMLRNIPGHEHMIGIPSTQDFEQMMGDMINKHQENVSDIFNVSIPESMHPFMGLPKKEGQQPTLHHAINSYIPQEWSGFASNFMNGNLDMPGMGDNANPMGEVHALAHGLGLGNAFKDLEKMGLIPVGFLSGAAENQTNSSQLAPQMPNFDHLKLFSLTDGMSMPNFATPHGPGADFSNKIFAGMMAPQMPPMGGSAPQMPKPKRMGGGMQQQMAKQMAQMERAMGMGNGMPLPSQFAKDMAAMEQKLGTVV